MSCSAALARSTAVEGPAIGVQCFNLLHTNMSKLETTNVGFPHSLQHRGKIHTQLAGIMNIRNPLLLHHALSTCCKMLEVLWNQHMLSNIP